MATETHWLADNAFIAFKSLRNSLGADDEANEATTRLRVIDRVLFEVLRWDHNEVRPESYVERVGYLDYEFGVHPQCALVLEAKREGKAFVLPNQVYGPDPVPFGLIATECKAAAAALTQAQNYANQRGSRYSAISNGHQWLLSMTFVPNQSIDDRLVFVFESLDAIESKFRVFFNCFSPTAIHVNLPSGHLLDARRAPAPPKLSATINGYPVNADRNVLWQAVGGVLQRVWDAIDQDQDNEVFLTNCYIPSEPSADMLRVARSLLTTRAETDERLAVEPQKAARKTIIEQRERADREQPVVILGRIGHGKSTFLKYLRHVEAKDVLSNKYIQFDLNFLTRPAVADEVHGFVLEQVEDQLATMYGIDVTENAFTRRVLKQELLGFQKSPRGVLLASRPAELADAEVSFIETITGNRDRYMGLVMRFIRRSQAKSVALFFDNLDRRTDQLQEQAFLRAAAMASEWGVMVFVCLRPGTVQRSSAYGVLDTVAPRTLVIPQPDIRTVLRKRFQYATRYAARNLPPYAYSQGRYDDETEEQLPAAAKFFDMCNVSVHRNPALADQYGAVSNGNIRKVMDYVRKVLVSRHLDTHKIISILNTVGEYVLPVHETLRAMIYGPFIHFDPNTSLFLNLFDLSHADPTEHFSRLLLLDFCQRHANSLGSYGFVSVSSVIDYMTALGYAASHAEEALNVLLERDCIEGHDEHLDQDRDKDKPVLGKEVRITALGSFHVTTLVRQFQYADAVVVDTPILDDATRTSQIRDVRHIRERLDRARTFLRYLERQAEHLTDADARRVLADIFAAVVNDITDIEDARPKGR